MTNVHKLTSMATEASGELWSPDGKNILFTSDVYPECDGTPEAETACNASKLKEFKESKVKALIFDHLLYRHWNAYKKASAPTSSQFSHVRGLSRRESTAHRLELRPPIWRMRPRSSHVARRWPRDLTPGDYDAPVFSLGGQDNYAFSPDGQEICYTSNHDKNPAASTNNDLWIVPVSGGPGRI